MTQNELAHTGAALEILGLGIAFQGAVFFSCLRRGLSSARLFVGCIAGFGVYRLCRF